MTTLLLLDTSSEAQVVGLYRDNEDLIERFEIVGRGHSRQILPTISSLLEDSGVDKHSLDAIVYGRGPGSFTGVRIAVGVVQGLGFGLGIPTVGLSTLAAMAQDALRDDGKHAVVALAARADEVYFGSYTSVAGIATLNGSEGVFRASAVPAQTFGEFVGVGSGWVLRDDMESALEARATRIELEAWPRARGLLDLGLDVIRRGDAEPASAAKPEYLRERVARPGGA